MMGSYKNIGDPVKQAAKFWPMMYSSKLAKLMMKNAKILVSNKIREGLEINSELSKELIDGIHSMSDDVEYSCGFSYKDIDYYYAMIEEGKYSNFSIYKCTVGVQVKSYLCHFVRSFGVGLTDKAKENYNFMLFVYEKILENLTDGMELCKVYEIVHSLAEKKNPILVKHLGNEFGFQLSPIFKKECITISSSTKVIVQINTFFAVNVNLIGLKEEEMEYNLHTSDTVHIRKGKPPGVMTSCT